MRRTLVGIYLGLFGLAAITVTALAAPTLARAGQAQGRVQANQRAARRDARQLLERLRLPPTDITAPRTIPAFARGFLTNSSPASTDYAGASRWEVASASPRAIIAYVRKHRPAGSTLDFGSGSSSDSKTGVTSIDVQFSWPDVSGQLLNRSLTVTVATPRHGPSVVIARSESAWFVPRPVSESVPAGVHTVAVTVRLGPALPGPVMKPGGKVHTMTYVISRAARVATLVNSFDQLPIVQPSSEPVACPLLLTGSSASQLTLAFMTGRHGRILARAQVYIHRGRRWEDGGSACDPIDFWIGGRRQTELTSPSFVKQVGSMVGADIS